MPARLEHACKMEADGELAPITEQSNVGSWPTLTWPIRCEQGLLRMIWRRGRGYKCQMYPSISLQSSWLLG